MLRILTFITCVFLAGTISGADATLCHVLGSESTADLVEERSENREETEEYRLVKKAKTAKLFLAYTYFPLQQRISVFHEDFRWRINALPLYLLHENYRL